MRVPTSLRVLGSTYRTKFRVFTGKAWLLASWADQTEQRLSLPQASTSGLPVVRSPCRLPDITTAPNGELRRQDLHLQVQQLVSLRSLLPGRIPDTLEIFRQCVLDHSTINVLTSMVLCSTRAVSESL